MLQDLTDQEAAAYTSFFTTTQGSLHPFLFLDPTANLLLWSEDFTQSAWTAPGLTLDPAIADPFGGAAAQRAHNQAEAPLTIAQQSQMPGSVQTCFSVYLRADAPLSITLTISANNQSQSMTADVTTVWQRFYVTAVFPGATNTLNYGITVPTGASVELYGPQVDAQVTPSSYVATSGSSGVYSNARFDATDTERIATGPNRNTCVMYIRCNVPGGDNQ